MRQIFVCMDGTWNDPTEHTNVYKFFRLLPGAEQTISERGPIRSHLLKESQESIAFYLEGVGARGRQQGVLAGSLGLGLHDRVIDACLLVSQAYRPGDKIWILGFSRGSWSARSLAGLIAGAGLVDDAGGGDAAVRAESLWMDFKHRRTAGRGNAYWQGRDEAPIRMVGVWDTVGALGIPAFNGLRVVDGVEKRLFDFADLDLSPRVQFGRHGLAIDETRFDFAPTLWNDRAGIEQVWFAGVHSDVGGGYHHAGLSDIALQWMVGEVMLIDPSLSLDCAALGVSFSPDPLQDRHDEGRKAIWKLRPRQPRAVPTTALVHDSVIVRMRGRPDYRPACLRTVNACSPQFAAGQNPLEEHLLPLTDLPMTRRLQVGESADCIVFAQKWWNAAGVEVVAGETYRLEATGSWTDRENKAGADGYPSDTLMLRMAEGSRRVEDADWFVLVAAVNADGALELKNPESGNFVTAGVESLVTGVAKLDRSSQRVAVGSRSIFRADRSGYLYFFANDSSFAYSNNSGFLVVTVSRIDVSP